MNYNNSKTGAVPDPKKPKTTAEWHLIFKNARVK